MCREYCKRNDRNVNRVFIEKGESAKTANRPEIRELLAYCRPNKSKLNFVVVHSLSRFSRQTAIEEGWEALDIVAAS
jgi:site-specific DNA recombinase